jgi:hypothetical protein
MNIAEGPRQTPTRPAANPAFETAVEKATQICLSSVGLLIKHGGAFTPKGNILLMGVEKIPRIYRERLVTEHMIRVNDISDFSNSTQVYGEGGRHEPLTRVYLLEPNFTPHLVSLQEDESLNPHRSSDDPRLSPMGILQKFIGEFIQQKVGAGSRIINSERRGIAFQQVIESLVNAHKETISNPQRRFDKR